MFAGTAARKDHAIVFDLRYPRLDEKIDAGLVADRFMQAGHQGFMVAGHALTPAGVREHDRLRTVLRKHHETLTLGAAERRVEAYPDVAQHAYGGRMQPLAGQARGRPGVRLEQRNARALPRMGEGAIAARRPRANDDYVVAWRGGAAHLNRLACERRR